jgi:hypothetical protein
LTVGISSSARDQASSTISSEGSLRPIRERVDPDRTYLVPALSNVFASGSGGSLTILSPAGNNSRSNHRER